MSTTVMAERYKTKVPPSLRSQFKERVNKYREGQKRASTRSVNILKDKDFEKSRKVLAAKRKSLIHEHGKGNKPQATTALKDKDEDALFEIGEFRDSNPVSLQRTVWWPLSLHFGFRAKDESRKLCWGDVQLQQDKDDKEMLVWLSERETKTRHGQEKSTSSNHQRRMSLPLSRAPSSSEKSNAFVIVEDLQMASCSSSRNLSSMAAVNSMINSSMDLLLASTTLVLAGTNISLSEAALSRFFMET